MLQPETQILADDSEESAIDARIAELEKVGSSQVHTSHAVVLLPLFLRGEADESFRFGDADDPKTNHNALPDSPLQCHGPVCSRSCATMPTSRSPAVQSQMLATLPATLEDDDVLTTHEQSLLVLQQVLSLSVRVLWPCRPFLRWTVSYTVSTRLLSHGRRHRHRPAASSRSALVCHRYQDRRGACCQS